jgi:hypothetical protein
VSRQRDHSLFISGIAPQPDFSRGFEARISTHREHSNGTNVLLQSVHLKRLTLQENALPFQGSAVRIPLYITLFHLAKFVYVHAEAWEFYCFPHFPNGIMKELDDSKFFAIGEQIWAKGYYLVHYSFATSD